MKYQFIEDTDRPYATLLKKNSIVVAFFEQLSLKAQLISKNLKVTLCITAALVTCEKAMIALIIFDKTISCSMQFYQK